MRRARRVLGIAWRVGVVAVSALVFAGAAVSEARYIFWNNTGWDAGKGTLVQGFSLSRGRAWFTRYRHTSLIGGMWESGGLMTVANDAADGAGLPQAKGRLDWRCVRKERGVWGTGWTLDLPLWPLAGIGGVVSLLAARGLRRGRRGVCAACGYDLAGLSGGVCPECGVSVAAIS